MPSHIDLSRIPTALQDLAHWVVWRWVVREGKRTKPPFDPRTDRPGDATDPSLWMTFERALALLPRFDGLGFAISDSPFCGADLDRCLDEHGQLAPWAEAIIRRLNSYTERTPSGTGLRIWVRGKLPPGRRRQGLIEFYDHGRYFTVTGMHLEGTPLEIEERSAELLALHSEIFPSVAKIPGQQPAPTPLDLSDDELLRKAFNSKNGAAIRLLYEGDTSAYGGDESAADLALCAHLAFWLGGDIGAIDRVFRSSGLYREKWDRADYRERTIAKALEGANFYNPHHGRNGQGATVNGQGPPSPDDVPPTDLRRPTLPSDPYETSSDPHRLARLYLGLAPAPFPGGTLLYWNEQWHRWDHTAWRVCPDKEIAAELTARIKQEFDRIARGTGKPVAPVTLKVVGNALQALRSLALLRLCDCPAQPAWIGPREPGEDLPPPSEVLSASNTLVHLPSFIAEEPAQLPLTPRFFSANSLGYPFLPDAPAPVEWLKFLGSLWTDDGESIASLQEWMGYLLMPDTSQQKILMIIGPKRSGKGTIARLIRSLVGPDNVTAPTLSCLATNFGLSPLIGKTVAVIADARLSGRADAQVIVERLLSISGEDAQSIDRKNRDYWSGRLLTRFVLISNELPRLGDSSGALPSRMVLLRLTQSFYGREDTSLMHRLLAERSAILLWAIEGWSRLRQRGYFTQPESGLELLDDLNELSSPVASFVEERCDVHPQAAVEVKDLFEEWKRFCTANGKDHPGDLQGFGRNLRAFFPELKMARPHEEGKRVRKYLGIGLKPLF